VKPALTIVALFQEAALFSHQESSHDEPLLSQTKRTQAEFGDFQTPLWLAQQVCALLSARGIRPVSLLEPTCGVGNFLVAALDHFPQIEQVIATDINPDYVTQAQKRLAFQPSAVQQLFQADFFTTDWPDILERLPQPILILGNPPWVTNAALSTLNSDNLPQKENGGQTRGILAITGGGNFDVSEWIIQRLLDWTADQEVITGMLCKTAVARKLLHHLWQNRLDVGQASIHLIDAKAAFDVNVDACLFLYQTQPLAQKKSCPVFADLSFEQPIAHIGFQEGQLIANLEYYQRWQHLAQSDKVTYKWRSGIKHDCARVMELTRCDQIYVNQIGKSYELEDACLYPLLKSSDIARTYTLERHAANHERWLLVPQRRVGSPTRPLQYKAPKTWAYLQEYGRLLDQRKSRIYQNRPRFSIFGVGSYSFAPWKVAISGLYKRLNFVTVGPIESKPVMLDDTCYFLPCANETEAKLLAALLNSTAAQEFYQARIFWDAKRPITAKILQQLDIMALAQTSGQLDELLAYSSINWQPQPQQLSLL
jgi:hypothetical protein